MKTNEAPEKLYLGSKQRPDKEIFFVFATPVENDDIEYTRTDAFIEKAVKWINEHTSLSEKLVIENFVSYMKGE